MPEGRFVWYELMTSDVADARRFYAAVVGWSVSEMPDLPFSYQIAHAGGQGVAGIMGVPSDMGSPRPTWFGYIGVADVDAKAEAVTAAGGAIHRPPTDIPGVGRFAVASDPQGAPFMLFRGTGEAPPELSVATPGAIGWRELVTSDWPAAFAFYGGLFGWEKAQAVEMGPMGTYQTFMTGDLWAGGMMNAPGGQPPGWLFYFSVDDIAAAEARVKAAGGAVVSGPHQVPGGSWILQGTDPQGVLFALTGPRA